MCPVRVPVQGPLLIKSFSFDFPGFNRLSVTGPPICKNMPNSKLEQLRKNNDQFAHVISIWLCIYLARSRHKGKLLRKTWTELSCTKQRCASLATWSWSCFLCVFSWGESLELGRSHKNKVGWKKKEILWLFCTSHATENTDAHTIQTSVTKTIVPAVGNELRLRVTDTKSDRSTNIFCLATLLQYQVFSTRNASPPPEEEPGVGRNWRWNVCRFAQCVCKRVCSLDCNFMQSTFSETLLGNVLPEMFSV